MKIFISLIVTILSLSLFSQELTEAEKDKARKNGRKQARQYLNGKWETLTEGENRRRSLYEGYRAGENALLTDHEVNSAKREGRAQAVQIVTRIKNKTDYKAEASALAYDIVSKAYRRATLNGSGSPTISEDPGVFPVPSNFLSPNGFRNFVSENNYSGNHIVDHISEYEEILNISVLRVEDLENANYSNKLYYLNSSDVFSHWKLKQDWYNYYSSYDEKAYNMRYHFESAFKSAATNFLNSKSYYYSKDYGAYNHAYQISANKTKARKQNEVGRSAFNKTFKSAGLVSHYRTKVREHYPNERISKIKDFKENAHIELNGNVLRLDGAFIPGGSMTLKLGAGAVRNIGEKKSGKLTFVTSSSSEHLQHNGVKVSFELEGLSKSSKKTAENVITVNDGLNVDNNEQANIILKLNDPGRSRISTYLFEKKSSLYELLALVMQGQYEANEISNMLIEEFNKAVREKNAIYKKDNERITRKETPRSKLGKLIFKYEETTDASAKAIIKNIIHDFRGNKAIQAVYSKTQWQIKSNSKYHIKRELVQFFERTVGND